MFSFLIPQMRFLPDFNQLIRILLFFCAPFVNVTSRTTEQIRRVGTTGLRTSQIELFHVFLPRASVCFVYSKLTVFHIIFDLF